LGIAGVHPTANEDTTNIVAKTNQRMRKDPRKNGRESPCRVAEPFDEIDERGTDAHSVLIERG